MTMYSDHYDEGTIRALDLRDDLRRLNALESAYFGPLAGDAKRRWPDVVYGKVSSNPNEPAAAAFAQHATLWVLDRKSPLYGIWGLNATSKQWVQAAERAQVPWADGYYKRIADEIPSAKSIKDAMREGVIFGNGFAAEIQRLYPEAASSQTTSTSDTSSSGDVPKPQPLKRPTLELTVIDNEIIANKTASESAQTEEHEGHALAGPGAWERFMKDAKPADFGLPRPILAFQEDSGEVTAATEEYQSVVEAAQKNDPGAQEALRHLGLRW